MKVLVIDPNPLEREQSALILSQARHEVLSVSDPLSAMLVLGRQKFDVVVVELVGPQRGGLDFVRRACRLEGSPAPYIVATASRPTPGDVGDAFQAGADDFLRKPVARDELLARVDGLERSRRRSLRRMRTPSLEDVNRAPSDLEAWRTVDGTICTELSEMVGSTLLAVEGDWDPADAICIAQASLSRPTDDYQVVVTIAANAASALALGERLLGSSDLDLASTRDMVRELCNCAAASFKRSAALEGLIFTTGIPVDATAAALGASDAQARRRWIALDSTGFVLRCQAEIRRTSREMLPTASLREGMILINDLTNGSGALLLRGGTRLTQSHLEHLRKAIGERGIVEVSLAA